MFAILFKELRLMTMRYDINKWLSLVLDAQVFHQ